VLALLSRVMVAIWPSSVPSAVPVMANPAAASLALTTLSPAMVAIAIVGGVSPTVSAWVA
jgi:hypothetical protein